VGRRSGHTAAVHEILDGHVGPRAAALMALAEAPQCCSSKFPTLAVVRVAAVGGGRDGADRAGLAVRSSPLR